MNKAMNKIILALLCCILHSIADAAMPKPNAAMVRNDDFHDIKDPMERIKARHKKECEEMARYIDPLRTKTQGFSFMQAEDYYDALCQKCQADDSNVENWMKSYAMFLIMDERLATATPCELCLSGLRSVIKDCFKPCKRKQR